MRAHQRNFLNLDCAGGKLDLSVCCELLFRPLDTLPYLCVNSGDPGGDVEEKTWHSPLFLPAIYCLVVEYVQGQAPGRIVTTHNVTADLFGIAAGILLGLNIRVMRSSTKTNDHANSDTPRSILC